MLRIFEAMFRSWLRGYEVTLDLCLKYRPIVMLVMIGTLVRHRLALHRHSQGVLPGRGYRLHQRHRRRSVGHLLRRHAGAHAADRGDRAQGSGGGLRQSHGGRRRTESDQQLRTCVRCAEAARRAWDNSTAVIQRLRGPANSFTGMATYLQNVQNINITGRISKSEFQYTLQSSDTATLYRVGPEMLEKISQARGSARRHRRSLYQEPADDDPDRPRGGRGLWRVAGPDPPGTVRLLRRQAGRDDLHRDQRLPGDRGVRSAHSGRSHRAQQACS